jgi:ketosteroid isomerase-like protein
MTTADSNVGSAGAAARQMLDAYTSAVFAKDVDAFMRLYDPGVRVFDAWGVWSYDGAASWRKTVEAWFTSLGTERVKVTFEDVSTSCAAELTLLSAFVTYAGASAEGEQLRSMTNRITWGLRTTGNVLAIVHEHTSAPIGFDDARAILRRDAHS